jgi:hypothetical protein
MPGCSKCVDQRPPRVFAIQTRGPLICVIWTSSANSPAHAGMRQLLSDDESRGRAPLVRAALRHIRRAASYNRRGREARIPTFATLAPLLPCRCRRDDGGRDGRDGENLIGDPLHIRAVKRRGATTREAARRIAERHGHTAWFEPDFQAE